MKQYDFDQIRKFLTANSDIIFSATLGMNEDWFWTAETVFSDGEFSDGFDTATEIAGISGSSWATPTIEIIFKDGREQKLECSTGEFEEDQIWRIEKEMFVKDGLGCLSTPVQENRSDVIGKLGVES